MLDTSITIEKSMCSKCGLKDICSKQNEVQIFLDRIADAIYDNRYTPLEIEVKCKFFIMEVER